MLKRCLLEQGQIHPMIASQPMFKMSASIRANQPLSYLHADGLVYPHLFELPFCKPLRHPLQALVIMGHVLHLHKDIATNLRRPSSIVGRSDCVEKVVVGTREMAHRSKRDVDSIHQSVAYLLLVMNRIHVDFQYKGVAEHVATFLVFFGVSNAKDFVAEGGGVVTLQLTASVFVNHLRTLNGNNEGKSSITDSVYSGRHFLLSKRFVFRAVNGCLEVLVVDTCDRRDIDCEDRAKIERLGVPLSFFLPFTKFCA